MYISKTPGWPVTTVGGTLRVLGRSYSCLCIRTMALPGRRYRIYYLTDGSDRVYRFGGRGLYRIEWADVDAECGNWRPRYNEAIEEGAAQ